MKGNLKIPNGVSDFKRVISKGPTTLTSRRTSRRLRRWGMKRFENPILVTRLYLPSLEEFKRGLEEVWSNQWLTNNGPRIKKLRAKI